MIEKETWGMRAARLLEEAQTKETDWVQKRLGWEDWETLLGISNRRKQREQRGEMI